MSRLGEADLPTPANVWKLYYFSIGAGVVRLATLAMTPTKLTFALFLPLAVFLASGNSSLAVDKIWTGTSSGIWNTSGNWSPSGAPTSTDNTIFNSPGAGNLTVDTSGNVTINQLMFNADASSNVTINANNNFRLEGVSVNSGSTGTHTLSATTGTLNIGTNNVANGTYDYRFTNNSSKLFSVTSTSGTWSSANQTSGAVVRNWIFDGSGDVSIGATMTMTNASMAFQTVNLLKSGAGTLTLQGLANNYNGLTKITDGVLAVSKLDNGGSTSSIGVSSSAAGNLVIEGGALRYIGTANSSTDRLFTAGTGSNGATLDASGTGNLSFLGTGTVAFTAANTASTLTLTGFGTGNNTMGANLILADNGSGALSVVKNGTGTWLMAGTNTYTGGTTLNSGTLLASSNFALGTGTLTFNGGTLSSNGSTSRTFSNDVLFSGSGGFGQSGATGTIILNGNINLGGAVRTIVTEGGGANFNAASGLVTNGGILKSGTGALILSGNNTYSGGTWLTDGSLLVGTSSGLGTGTLTISGGTLAAAKTTAVSLSNNLQITGDFTLGATSLGGTGQLTFTGTLDLAGGTRSITVENTSQRINGSIINGGLVKLGSGTLQLNGNANTYSGGTTIKAGTLLLSKSNALPTSGPVTIEGGVLDLGGFDAQAALVTFSGGSVTNGILSATSFSGQSGTVSATLAGTGTTLTKSTSGTLTLSGTNTYTGATQVNAGTLIVNGSISSSSTTVASGGRLAGNGTTGNLTIASGGQLTPGDGIGILTAGGNFDLQNGASLVMELTGSNAVAGVDYDQLHVTGNILLGGTLTLSLSSFTASEGTLFFLIDNAGLNSITGTFAGLAQGTIFTQSGSSFRISYTANSSNGEFTGGNDVALEVVAIPEASTWQLTLGFGLAWGILRMRRGRMQGRDTAHRSSIL